MPTYKQITTWTEDPSTPMMEIFVISDTYLGASDLSTALEIGFIEMEGTKKDLDIATGVYAEDELSFTMKYAAIIDADDQACWDLVLTAQTGTKVYCSRIINPANPLLPVPAEFDFRGVVRSDMAGDDVGWEGAAYSSATSPARDWKCSAGTYGINGLLSKPVKQIAASISDAWIAANASDKVGYFTGEVLHEEEVGTIETRWASLVRFDVAIQKLLDEAAEDGVAFTYEWEPQLDHFLVYPVRYDTGADTYLIKQLSQLRIGPECYKITLGGTGTTGCVWISSRLLKPLKHDLPIPPGETEPPETLEEKAAWTRYETLMELLFDIAGCLGLYVHFDYVTPTDVRVRFKARTQVLGSAVLLRDADSASVDVQRLDPNDKDETKGTIVGRPVALWQHSLFPGHYDADNGMKGWKPYDAGGDHWPLTIMPAMRYLSAGSASRRAAGDTTGPSIPHNVTLWQTDGTPQKWRADNPQYNAAALTTQMFMEVPRTGWETGGTLGSTMWAPAGAVHAQMPYLPEYLDTPVYQWRMTTQEAFLRELVKLDRQTLVIEREITAPYLNAFKLTALGAESWQNVQLGSVFTEDGRDQVVVSIERKQLETTLGLHATARFQIGAIAPDDPYDGVMPNHMSGDRYEVDADLASLIGYGGESAELASPISAYVVGAVAVAQHQIVAVDADGNVIPMLANHDFYGKYAGVALDAGGPGEYIRVQAGGRVFVDLSTALTPGEPLYLRGTPVMVDPQNIVETPLLASTASEDLYLELGVADTGGFMMLHPGTEIVIYPRI